MAVYVVISLTGGRAVYTVSSLTGFQYTVVYNLSAHP